MKSQISNPESRILACAIIVSALWLLGGMSGCAHLGAEKKDIWHQLYEPVESQEVHAFAKEAFAEAIRLYGQPDLPVREIHIRQSIRRKHPAQLARADILNWNRLAETLYTGRNISPMNRVWREFGQETRTAIAQAARGEDLSFVEQIRIVQGLNRLIKWREFYDPRSFDSVTLPASVQRRARRDVRSLSRSKLERFNRSLLEALFQDRIVPLQKWKRLARGFELCERTDGSPGRFTLYVSASPDNPEFYLQLAHETCHLLNPEVYDWHMEGLCNVFAEHMARKTGRTWQPWRKRFASRRDRDPYAIAYFMMQEVHAAAGEYMKEFVRFVVWSDRKQGRMRMDIDAWLAVLPADRREKVLDILRRYGPKLRRHG